MKEDPAQINLKTLEQQVLLQTSSLHTLLDEWTDLVGQVEQYPRKYIPKEALLRILWGIHPV